MAIRYMKLQNPFGQGWICRLHIGWKGYTVTTTEGGIIQRVPNGQSGTFKDDFNICIAEERTIDMTKTNIPDQSDVWLEPWVKSGKDGPASPTFIFDKTAGDTAAYKLTGSLWANKTLTAI